MSDQGVFQLLGNVGEFIGGFLIIGTLIYVAESKAMSKALKKRGFSFVGPTIVHALMQATGLVNDHIVSCFRHQECAHLRR